MEEQHNPTVTIKIGYYADTRQFTLPDVPDYDQLRACIMETFPSLPSIFEIRTNLPDVPTISSDKELKHAFDLIRNEVTPLLRLNVTPSVNVFDRPTENSDLSGMFHGLGLDTSHTNESGAEEDSQIHRAFCDNCQEIIVGVRYKCYNCPDYDLVSITTIDLRQIIDNCCSAKPVRQDPEEIYIPPNMFS